MFINKYALTKSGRRKPQSAYIRLNHDSSDTKHNIHRLSIPRRYKYWEGAKRRIPQNRLIVLSGDLWVDPPHESRSKFSRLAGVVQHSCEPISIWSISHLFPILQWSNQNNLRSNITTSLIDQILTKQEIYQLQIKIFLFEIIRTPLCLIRSNRSQAREAQRWSKTGTKKKNSRYA